MWKKIEKILDRHEIRFKNSDSSAFARELWIRNGPFREARAHLNGKASFLLLDAPFPRKMDVSPQSLNAGRLPAGVVLSNSGPGGSVRTSYRLSMRMDIPVGDGDGFQEILDHGLGCFLQKPGPPPGPDANPGRDEVLGMLAEAGYSSAYANNGAITVPLPAPAARGYDAELREGGPWVDRFD